MMGRPIIDKNVLTYLRNHLSETNNPKLLEIRREAQLEGIPIIPLETASFLQFLIKIKMPRKILEIGTAIGYSSLLMSIENPVKSQIVTFERNRIMYEKAIQNIDRLNKNEQIKIIYDDIANYYNYFEDEEFDLIFLDGAKAKYFEQYEKLTPFLKYQGIILIDDIFQGGDTLKAEALIKHRAKGIHRNLNRLLEKVLSDKKTITSVLPLGDGLLMIQKN